MSVGKKIAIVGSGANGSSIGADLIKAGHDVTLIDQWPAHIEAIRKDGLFIQMPHETSHVTANAFHLCDVATFREAFDYVLILVKAYDIRWAAHLIAPYLKSTGLAVAVQNGMTADISAEIFGIHRTLGCVIEISSGMFEPGKVVRHSPPPRSWFAVGAMSAETKGREHEVADLLRLAGACEIVDDIHATKWMKLVSNCTTLVTTAILDLPLHAATEMPGMEEFMLKAGQEALDVGVALGLPILPIFGLTPQDVTESNRVVGTLLDTLKAGFTLPQTTTTVLQDWGKGRHSEVNEINGLVVAKAREIGISTPANLAVCELARRIEHGELRPGKENLQQLLTLMSEFQ